MKISDLAIANKTSQFCLDCQAFEEELIAQIELYENRLKEISNLAKHTAEIKREKARLEEEIKGDRHRLAEVRHMLVMRPGQWVRNGSTRPGKITELKIVGRVPEVHVVWWQNTVPVPERPLPLKVIEDSDLEYIWSGEQHPKLLRRIDKFECEDLAVLADRYQSSRNCQKTAIDCDTSAEAIDLHQLEIVYCQKRFNDLVQEKYFPPGVRVQCGELVGTTLDYPQTGARGLVAVSVRLDQDERGNLLVERPFSSFELVNLSDRDYLLESKQKKILDFCNKPKLQTVPIAEIQRNGGTQQRAGLNHETVTEYAEAMRNGARFPPVKLKFDGENYWLTDGFHTTAAAWSIGRTEIEAEVTVGSLRDAILDSVSVNSEHGLRRSHADKRRAVMTLLKDREWGNWSDREIARRCKVSNVFVSKIRKEQCNSYNDKKIITVNVNSDNPRTYKDRYGNNSQMNTENIGNKDSANNEELLTVEPKNDNNGTDKQVAVQTSCPDKKSVDKHLLDAHRQLLSSLVKINPLNRCNDDLVGYKGSYAIVKQKYEHSADLEVWGHQIKSVAFIDLESTPTDVTFNASLSQSQLVYIMENFSSFENFIEYGILSHQKSAQ